MGNEVLNDPMNLKVLDKVLEIYISRKTELVLSNGELLIV